MKDKKSKTPSAQTDQPTNITKPRVASNNKPSEPQEVGGPKGPEPTRYGDWEKAGRCSDF